MVRRLWLLVIVLTACQAAPAATSTIGPPAPSAAATARAPASRAAAASGIAFDAVLPVMLGDVELHTFAVGQDIIERLAARLGIGVDEIEARFASDHGARFVQMYALQAPGVSGAQLLGAFSAAAYPPDASDVDVSEQQIAGKAVTVVTSPSTGARLGSFYAYASGDTLVVVQAFDPSVVAEALAALP